MVRAKPRLHDVERQLFEFSLGELRLLDTVLDKAGRPKLAALLRDLLVDWRAYPSRTKYSTQDLRKYGALLGRIAAGLRKAGQGAGADHAAQVRRALDALITR